MRIVLDALENLKIIIWAQSTWLFESLLGMLGFQQIFGTAKPYLRISSNNLALTSEYAKAKDSFASLVSDCESHDRLLQRQTLNCRPHIKKASKILSQSGNVYARRQLFKMLVNYFDSQKRFWTRVT
jgi:hypothetical protein